MFEHIPNLLAPKFFFLYAFIASAVFVHYRGAVRHSFYRQITDHSTFMAPYNVLMYMFSAVPNKPFIDVAQFPELKPLTDNWQTLRDEALKLFDEGHIRARLRVQRPGLQFLLSPRLEALLRQVVQRVAALRGSALPENRRAGRVDSDDQRRHVRDVAARRRPGQAPRSVRGFAALPPRACRRRIRTSAASGSTARSIHGATAKPSCSTRRSCTGRRTRPTRCA